VLITQNAMKRFQSALLCFCTSRDRCLLPHLSGLSDQNSITLPPVALHVGALHSQHSWHFCSIPDISHSPIRRGSVPLSADLLPTTAKSNQAISNAAEAVTGCK
jgi:hypothetical protein